MKFFIQFSQVCASCKRSVDIISRDDQAGLLFSIHGKVAGNLANRCVNSGQEFKR